MIERTYVMLKPDALKRSMVGTIINRIERKGYQIDDIKKMMLSEAQLKEHYAHIAHLPFFPEIVEFMTSGPVIAMVVSGDNAVAGVRKIMGATKFEDALAGTIRGDYASNTQENLIHGSDSVESAQIEIARFFGK